MGKWRSRRWMCKCFRWIKCCFSFLRKRRRKKLWLVTYDSLRITKFTSPHPSWEVRDESNGNLGPLMKFIFPFVQYFGAFILLGPLSLSLSLSLLILILLLPSSLFSTHIHPNKIHLASVKIQLMQIQRQPVLYLLTILHWIWLVEWFRCRGYAEFGQTGQTRIHTLSLFYQVDHFFPLLH